MDSNTCSQDNSIEAPIYHAGSTGSSGYNIPVEYINMMKFRYDNLQCFPFMSNYTNNDVKYEESNNYAHQYMHDKPSTSGFGVSGYWRNDHENKIHGQIIPQHHDIAGNNHLSHMQSIQNNFQQFHPQMKDTVFNPSGNFPVMGEMVKNDMTFNQHIPKKRRKEKKINKEKRVKKPKIDKKLLRQTGQEYKKSDGSIQEKKLFKNYNCKCIFRCTKTLPLETRQEIFNRFWALGSWDAQSAFLCSNITPVPVKRHNRTPIDNRKVQSFQYTLHGVRICKAVFCAALGVSKNRVTYIINCKIQSGGKLPRDKRGRKTPPNKLADETIQKISDFLDKFPKNKPQLSNNSKTTFSPDISFKKLHAMFLETNPGCTLSLPIFIREVNYYNDGTRRISKNKEKLENEKKLGNNKKTLRQTGQAYQKADGSIQPKKEFQNIICKCRLHCNEKLALHTREEIFEQFWALGSWDAQSAYICSCAYEIPVKKHTNTSGETMQKEYSFKYVLHGVRICKAVFCAALGVSKNRVTYILKNKIKSGSFPVDRRGRKTPPNKVSQETIQKIKALLDRFPKYKSQSSFSSKLYLPSDVKYKKLHALFLESNPDSSICLPVFIREVNKCNVYVTKSSSGVKKAKVKNFNM